MVWYLDSKSKHPKGHRQKPYHFLCPRIRRHSINLVIVIDLPRFKGREHHPFLSKDSVNGILKELDRGKYNLSQGTIYQMSLMPWWNFIYIYEHASTSNIQKESPYQTGGGRVMEESSFSQMYVFASFFFQNAYSWYQVVCILQCGQALWCRKGDMSAHDGLGPSVEEWEVEPLFFRWHETNDIHWKGQSMWESIKKTHLGWKIRALVVKTVDQTPLWSITCKGVRA